MKHSVEEIVDYTIRSSPLIQVYEELLHLCYWLNGFEPNNILEIGTHGPSFHLFSQFSKGKKVAVDINDNSQQLILGMQYHDWKFIVGDSTDIDTFNSINQLGLMYDFIFIDGNHEYEYVKRDFELYRSLLSPRGFLVFHDIDPDHVFAGFGKGGGNAHKFWTDLDWGSKTELITKKSSGKIMGFQKSEHFGGLGFWQPLRVDDKNRIWQPLGNIQWPECPECSSEITKPSNFCFECGVKLTK